MTPEQYRTLADRLETRCLPQIVQPDELARESADALRSAANQLEAVRHLTELTPSMVHPITRKPVDVVYASELLAILAHSA